MKNVVFIFALFVMAPAFKTPKESARTDSSNKAMLLTNSVTHPPPAPVPMISPGNQPFFLFTNEPPLSARTNHHVYKPWAHYEWTNKLRLTTDPPPHRYLLTWGTNLLDHTFCTNPICVTPADGMRHEVYFLIPTNVPEVRLYQWGL